jgi:hypothetical protein
MAKNPEEHNKPEKRVSRKVVKSIMKSCYVAGIIFTGIGAYHRNNSPNYKNWINAIDCGDLDPCAAVLMMAYSGIFEVLFISLFVSFLLVIFFAYNRLYEILYKKFPNRCIGCLVIKFVFLLPFSYLLFLFLEGIIYGDNLKWGFYILSLADIFIVAGMMIMFYLGLTLKKESSSDNKDTFWA